MALTNTQIAEMVEKKNKSAEEYASCAAQNLIDEIAREQERQRKLVRESNERIARYRKDLREISFETVTVADILGEEGGE